MKKYSKEIVILCIQLIMFYIFPLFIKMYQPIGMVIMILLTTLILSILLSIISNNKIKYLHPFIISIFFIPSVFIYYNSSALIHSIWYLIVSIIGLIIGNSINLITKIIKISK